MMDEGLEGRGPAFRHERLDVWDAAVELAMVVYRVTQSFPSVERFALTNQLRRCSVSVSSNIAEGNGRTSPRDKIRFFEIAYGSLMEVVSQIEVAVRLTCISREDSASIRRSASRIARQLSGLRAAVKRSPRP